MRVLQNDPASASITTLKVAKSKLKIMPLSLRGGGLYFKAKHGNFVILEHLHQNHSKNDKPLLQIGSFNSGTLNISLDIPKTGKVQILGDIIMHEYPKSLHGNLQIKVNKNTSFKADKVMVGAVVVGGIHGQTYPLDDKGKSPAISLAPGTYKIFFPDFDKRKSRWDITIKSRRTKTLKLKAISQSQLDMLP